ncbi:MAG: cysteine synthase A [Opitutae bacterium]|nr:cysteine synthase A [Opitutae bacterium]
MAKNKLYSTVADTIGNTPLVRLNRVTEGIKAEIFLKCEFRNPLFSVKDRVARSMIEAAEAAGMLAPGATIVEPTSGNTGIALAALAAAKGLKCRLVMPESMSFERRTLLRMLGAEVIITPKAAGMAGAIALAEKIVARTPGAFSPRQFDNPANPAAHYATTGPEIWDETGGAIDAFIAGVGTGGTISGTMKFLKEKNPNILGIAVEPASSAVLSGGKPGAHGIQGIGAGFVPKNYDASVVDKIVPVETEDALQTARRIAATEGIPIGISSGANVWAALQLATKPEYAGKRIVAIAASTTERYLSTPLAIVAAQEMAALPVTPLD